MSNPLIGVLDELAETRARDKEIRELEFIKAQEEKAKKEVEVILPTLRGKILDAGRRGEKEVAVMDCRVAHGTKAEASELTGAAKTIYALCLEAKLSMRLEVMSRPGSGFDDSESAIYMFIRLD